MCALLCSCWILKISTTFIHFNGRVWLFCDASVAFSADREQRMCYMDKMMVFWTYVTKETIADVVRFKNANEICANMSWANAKL